jgi:hypothetical protein
MTCAERANSVPFNPNVNEPPQQIPPVVGRIIDLMHAPNFDYQVEDGAIGWENPSTDFTCFGCNVSTPYILAELAPPFDDSSDVGSDGGAPYSWHWRLGEDEAMVLVGKTPYESCYLGFTQYLYAQSASLGDPFNQYTLRVADNPGVTDPWPFNRPFVLVVTANLNVAAQIHRLVDPLLLAAGVPSDEPVPEVNVLPVPAQVTGLEKDSGTTTVNIDPLSDLNILGRIAIPIDGNARNEYYSNLASYLHVFRFRSLHQPFAAYGEATYRQPLTSPTEVPEFDETLQAAVASVVAQHPDLTQSCGSVYTQDRGPDCIVSGTQCADDTSDALYSVVGPPAERLETEEGDSYRYVLVGVNNPRLGKATYESFNVDSTTTVPLGSGVLAFNDGTFPKSSPDPDIFVHTLARSCAPLADGGKDPSCTEVPFPEACDGGGADCIRTLGIGKYQAMSIVGRNYLEPHDPLKESTRPDPETLENVVLLTNNPNACADAGGAGYAAP